ncbi:RluA family pseudouridine synthase [Candidatus Parcubacteria bacterium]|nr:RluA family pseudouridine synthase [Candidatus Parcubacteria bacterium]
MGAPQKSNGASRRGRWFDPSIAHFLPSRERSNRPRGASSNYRMELSVIAETPHYVVLDKPAGMLTHPTSRHEPHTLAEAAVARWPDIARIGDSPIRPGLVHRLDKDTSGALIIARTQGAFEELKRLFAARKVKKTYLALVHGTVREDEGFVDLAVGRSTKSSVRRVTALNRGAKDLKSARTRFRVLKRLTAGKTDFTLLEISPETGRTHQIRVHLAHLGHPVAGDELYRQKRALPPPGLKRLFLHALRLEIPFPDGEKTFESPLPAELQTTLSSLEPKPES